MPEATPVQMSKMRGANAMYVETVLERERGHCLEYTWIGPPDHRDRVCLRSTNPIITITKVGPDPRSERPAAHKHPDPEEHHHHGA